MFFISSGGPTLGLWMTATVTVAAPNHAGTPVIRARRESGRGHNSLITGVVIDDIFAQLDLDKTGIDFGIGHMATEGDSGAFKIEGVGVVEFNVKNSDGTHLMLKDMLDLGGEAY
ncbi:hypothetical protein F5880DRAFT_1510691 [Lentinula raphanica]|nr:hypothetical protein F5880DRAFT_1510691 [Lentinula raphanica]